MKISKLLKICCAGMLGAGAMAICFAEDMPTENFREMRQRGQRGMRQRGQRGMRGMRGQGISGMPRMRMDVFGLDRINKESAIRAKFPAEMAELEKAKAELDAKYKALAATKNPRAFTLCTKTDEVLGAENFNRCQNLGGWLKEVSGTHSGIENLQEFTIFPKEVKNGQTIITA